jgi:hypothetical protein
MPEMPVHEVNGPASSKERIPRPEEKADVEVDL